jgi:hypothetical protein
VDTYGCLRLRDQALESVETWNDGFGPQVTFPNAGPGQARRSRAARWRFSIAGSVPWIAAAGRRWNGRTGNGEGGKLPHRRLRGSV